MLHWRVVGSRFYLAGRSLVFWFWQFQLSMFKPEAPVRTKPMRWKSWNLGLFTSCFLFRINFSFFSRDFCFSQFKFLVLFCGTGPFSSEDSPLPISENLEKRRSISKPARDQIVEFSVLNKSGKHLLPRKWNLQKNVKQPPWVIDAEFRYSLLHWKFN